METYKEGNEVSTDVADSFWHDLQSSPPLLVYSPPLEQLASH